MYSVHLIYDLGSVTKRFRVIFFFNEPPKNIIPIREKFERKD